jgi:hypothetical protein
MSVVCPRSPACAVRACDAAQASSLQLNASDAPRRGWLPEAVKFSAAVAVADRCRYLSARLAGQPLKLEQTGPDYDVEHLSRMYEGSRSCSFRVCQCRTRRRDTSRLSPSSAVSTALMATPDVSVDVRVPAESACTRREGLRADNDGSVDGLYGSNCLAAL